MSVDLMGCLLNSINMVVLKFPTGSVADCAFNFRSYVLTSNLQLATTPHHASRGVGEIKDRPLRTIIGTVLSVGWFSF